MRKRRVVIVAGVLAVLLAAVAATYAYDRSRRDTVAHGVAVGGVDVGGMTAGEARRTLARALERRLRAPVVVSYEERRFTLAPRRAKVALDLDGMVAAALQHSRDGWFLARVGREVAGGSLETDLPPQVTYDPRAVARFVARVADRLDRPPRDAQVRYSARALGMVRGRNGVRVDRSHLRRAVARALRQTGAARTVGVRATRIRPRVTRAQLPRKYPVIVTIDRARFQLYLWKRLRRVKTYTVAIGQAGFDTPTGLYHVQNKAVDPVWTVPHSSWTGGLAGQQIPPGPSNPLKARWLGIADGAGIHGTDDVASLGTAASHGCVRMAVPDVIELYDEVPVGAPIYIA